MASARSCEVADFCSEFAGDADVSFTRVYQGDPRSRLIVERDGLVLIADLSPLVTGHLLLLPARQYLSFAAVAREHLSTITSTIAWLLPIYIRTFGKFVILEHGSSEDIDHSACITHAHWHIVPIAADDLRRIIVADGLQPIVLSRLSELATSPWLSSSYFYVFDGVQHVLFEPVSGYPRQYLRSVMGRALSIDDPEWDYAVVVRKDLLRKTMQMTSSWMLR
jgi:diadenosine tetraphosphate (Ap4A) HIT family hydrolase